MKNADIVTLAHGAGGSEMHRLIDALFMRELDNPILRQKLDAAIVRLGPRQLALTTDSYVVSPLFFPGGDIGTLAVCGTVNDLALSGARPLFISLAMIIEEGLAVSVLRRVVRSVAMAAREAGVMVVTGDTKVVGRGACDRLFITTSGVGEVVRSGLSLCTIRPGDAVIVSGPVGDHAISILSMREGADFVTKVKSDVAPLGRLSARVFAASKRVRVMRDPTRGGLGATLNEFTAGRRFGIVLDERELPLATGVRAACELLGLEPLYLACEGRCVAIVAPDDARPVLRAMRADPHGRGARMIGVVTPAHPGKVVLRTAGGGSRIVPMPVGEQVPRIC